MLTGVLDDSFALSMAHQLPLTSLLTLMSAYGDELEYIVLSNLISVMLPHFVNIFVFMLFSLSSTLLSFSFYADKL